MTRRPAGEFLGVAELTVLHMLANGRTIDDIAAAHRITRDNVRRHQRNAYRKLGVTDLVTAVLAAIRYGILRPEEIVTGPLQLAGQLANAYAKLAAVRAFADRLDPDTAAELHRIIGTTQGDTHAQRRAVPGDL